MKFLFSRVLRFTRRYPTLSKFIRWPLFFFFIMWVATSSGSVANFLLYAGITVVFGPLILLALLQICFLAYHAIKHGDPFYERPLESERRVVYVNEGPKREKKMCPICKRPTNCKMSPKGASIPFHVIRN